MKANEAYNLVKYFEAHYVRFIKNRRPVYINARCYVLLVSLYILKSIGSIHELARTLDIDPRICHKAVQKLKKYGLINVEKYSQFAILSLKHVTAKALKRLEKEKDPVFLSVKKQLEEIIRKKWMLSAS